MLRIHTSENAAAAKTYYREGLVTSDYYVEKGVSKGYWGGKAAAHLGLSGEVTSKAFDRLADNKYPITGEKLTPRTKLNRRIGYDATFNAPKSVSILYGLGDVEMRRSIHMAFNTAIEQTMLEMEQSMHTRVRTNGQKGERQTGNMVWGRFIHDTARPISGIPDPHLHAHNFIFNTTFDKHENRYKAGEFVHIKKNAPYFQAVFHNHFASHLKHMGFGITQTKNSWEVVGVPKDIIKGFSRRACQIEQIADEKGITDPKQKAGLAAKTRASKKEMQSPKAIMRDWKARYEHLGGNPIDSVKKMKALKPLAVKQVVARTLDHLLERQSTVSLRKVMQTALTYGVGHVSKETIHQELLKKKAIIHKVNGEQRVTLPHILKQEQQLVSIIKKGRGSSPKLVKQPVSLENTIMNRQQKEAVNHVLQSVDKVIALTGIAGTGKTTVMKTITKEIEATDKQVVAVAPTSDASRSTLRQEGFSGANTVARLLQDEQMQKRLKDNVLWADEAWQMGVQTMLSLFKLADKHNARLILTGDPMQHKSVERGNAYALLKDHAGLHTHHLSSIVRQKSSLYRNAVSAAHQGKMTVAIEWLHTMDAFKEISDADTRYQQLADDYFKCVHKKQTTLVVSPTHAEADKAVPYIRERLKLAKYILGIEQVRTRLVPLHFTEAERIHPKNYHIGDVVQLTQNIKGFKRGEQLEILGTNNPQSLQVMNAKGALLDLPLSKSKHFEVYQQKQIALSKGDHIRITRNAYTKYGHHRLNSGAEYKIDRINQHGDLILNNGYQLHKEFNHLNYAYVTTSYASQSKTVDNVLVAQSRISFGNASSREQFYVSLSRGRKAIEIYTDDLKGLVKTLTQTNERMNATDLQAKKPSNVSWFEDVKKNKAAYLKKKMQQVKTMARPLNRMTKN